MVTVRQYRSLWLSIIDKNLKDECYLAIAEKLKRIKFDRAGEMKPGELHLYAERHFPSLVNIYRINRQSLEIPKRETRTRVEHHSPKRDQYHLFNGNQLKLF